MKSKQLVNTVTQYCEDVTDLVRFGRTPLGIVAMRDDVFEVKDNYNRRERLVREWATEEFGEDYTTGVYHASNGIRRARNSRQYVRGYNLGRKVRNQLN